MPRRRLHTELDLSPVWRDLELPVGFPPGAEAEAAVARDGLAPTRRDARSIELVTVDPPGARDLDQALHVAEQPGGGWQVSYAIADVAAFVVPGGAVDVEATSRGETLYLPDGRVPLHPPALSEGAASLLPGQDRPAVLWTIDVAADGTEGDATVERALVRSRAQLDYAGLQAALDEGTAPAAARALPELGRARLALARQRGAIELGLLAQEVVPAPGGGWTIARRAPLPVEEWNAQLSLLTGMVAARLQLDAGVGLLRTLPDPDPHVVAKLRRAAPALGVAWPDSAAPAAVLAGCDPHEPRHAAFLELAAELLRGAGYTVVGHSPAETVGHAGIGGPYAHVTAPIRRLCDRYATEACLAAATDTPVPEWVSAGLIGLPEVMAASGRRARAAERTAIDHVEAWLLTDRVGETFEAAVVEHDEERERSEVALDEPAIRARCEGLPPLGERVEVRLVTADVATRTVRFAPT